MNDDNEDLVVMVVDDSPDILRVLGDVLSPHYRVRVANSGRRALAMLDRELPDLILLDVRMPDMDGYGVLAQLKANPVSAEIPVIFLTAMDSAEDEEKGLNLGAVDYITKPIRAAIVLARVQTQLELKRARDSLRNQNALLEAEVARRVAENELILDTAAEGIYGTDRNGVIRFINPAAAAMLGYTKDELLGRDSHVILHHSKGDGSHYPKAECPLHMALATGLASHVKEEMFWRKDGTCLPIEYSVMPMLQDGELRGAVVTLMDISDRQRYLKQLERQSNYDDLTGLPNRNLLRDRITHAIDRCEHDGPSLAVLLLNFNRFKEINETLGREAGDELLRSVARRLEEKSREADTLARLAGDEFVILADGSTSETALASGLLEAFATPFRSGDLEVFLSASIGIAIFPKDGRSAEALLQNASAAVNQAKAAGGNVFRFYATEMNARSLQRLELENDLRRAIERNELLLHYQPQLNLRTGEITGCEALIRWQHPRLGLVAPGVFIPLAEESGLIVPIGEWVLRTACRQNKLWQDAGLPEMTVAVNLSAHQFASQDIVALTRRVLGETGLRPGALELEITESAVMADAEAFIHATEDLQKIGVSLSLDDFGTGFSSLSYLKRLAVDRLKIDQSFVRDLTQDPDSASIAMAIISLGHTLKLSVIAEGVETEAQAAFLRRRGCDEMQGYHFSRPLPARDFEQLLYGQRKLTFGPEAELSSRCIMLVDDEPAILAALESPLRREGYEVLAATDGVDALEMMARQPVGVVITDARMPLMNGTEFLGRVRELHPDSVRIMLTGHKDLQAVTEAVNQGEIFKLLIKPWDEGELLEMVRDAFLRHEVQRRTASEKPMPKGSR